MARRLEKLLLAAANILIPIAILIFATGFFPYKPFMPGLAKYEPLGIAKERLGDSPPAAVFDKVVFMVVDALRSDFVFGEGSGFEFVQRLISSGYALPFTAHATSPTITMPRVKAITTGSIPSFLDVILNFAESDTTSTLATQDTWLAQLKTKEDGKLVMYGDDTWLKLFPDFFARADGTSSFFVADFTEVDDNVTRHVPEELMNSDWNGFIMHYLGLDHIGHKAGPHSPNMLPKQIEMDGIAETIYSAIEEEPHLESTLFVLCGDHGMNEGGNHGGSAPGETSPALVFMSPKLHKIARKRSFQSPAVPKGDEFDFYSKIEQSDIAPTLAGLLGFPVPLNNLGVFIPDFLDFWDREDKVKLLLSNAQQMLRIVKATFPGIALADEGREVNCEGSLSRADELACKWQDVHHDLRAVAEGKMPDGVLDKLLDFCRTAQSIMSSTASNYDVSKLVVGSVLAFVSVALSVFLLRRNVWPPSSTGIFYTLTLLLYAVLMFASSYVEEEHHFWYWVTSAWFGYLFVVDSRTSPSSLPKPLLHPTTILLLLHRLTRRWNQTGQKFAGSPDIAHSPLLTHSLVLWSLVGATYLHLTLRLAGHVAYSISAVNSRKEARDRGVGNGGNEEDGEHGNPADDGNRFLGLAAMLPLGVTAFTFKLGFTARDAPELVQGITGGVVEWVEGISLVGTVRTVFMGIAASVGWLVVGDLIVRRRKGGNGSGKGARRDGRALSLALFDFMSLFLITQTRAQNIPLYLIFRMQLFFLALLPLTPTQISLTTLLLTHTSFFALGNSNAISSIDLSNSYNGVSGYNFLAVGILVFMSNWAGPIWWSGAGVILLLGRKESAAEDEEGKEGGGGDAKNISTTRKTRSWVELEHSYLHTVAKQHANSASHPSPLTPSAELDPSPIFSHILLSTLFTSLALLAVMTSCTLLRTHLFIWTVFSPKFLYAMAWGLAWHVGVGWAWCGVLWGVVGGGEVMEGGGE